MAKLYVLQYSGSNFFKVGKTTKSVEERIGNLKTGAPEELRCLLSLPVSPSLLSDAEGFVHASLAHLRFGAVGGREFFSFAGGPDAFARLVREALARFEAAASGAAALQSVRCAGERVQLEDLEQKEVLLTALMRRRHLAAEIRRAEIEAKLLDEQLKNALGDTAEIVNSANALLVGFSKTSRRCFDIAAFRAAHPDLAEKFTVDRCARTLRVP